jgi:hypothetical protein
MDRTVQSPGKIKASLHFPVVLCLFSKKIADVAVISALTVSRQGHILAHLKAPARGPLTALAIVLSYYRPFAGS